MINSRALAACIHACCNMACPVTHVSKLCRECNISNDGYSSELQSSVFDLPFQMSAKILAFQDDGFWASLFPSVEVGCLQQACKCDHCIVFGLGYDTLFYAV
jgi:hypothetical protein